MGFLRKLFGSKLSATTDSDKLSGSGEQQSGGTVKQSTDKLSEREKASNEEMVIHKTDWIAYTCFYRGKGEKADRYYDELLAWSKENPPPASCILCRFDIDRAGYCHFVGCIANETDCYRVSSWKGNDFYTYQKETNTYDESPKESGTVPLPHLMSQEMVIDMIRESRCKKISGGPLPK